MIKLEDLGIVPVVEISDSNKAVNLAKALVDGGIKAIEVTFRTPEALESIKKISESDVDILLGAGTVLTTKQADEAIEAGVDFLVSPGFNEKVVQHCIDKQYTIYPGVNTPSQIETAMSMGLSILKFFPAEASGGLKMIKSLLGPYKNIRFMPTGGINGKNIGAYLRNDKILCCGGSWMIDKNKLANNDFEGITKDAKAAIFDALDIKVLGIADDGKLLIDCSRKNLLPDNLKEKVIVKE